MASRRDLIPQVDLANLIQKYSSVKKYADDYKKEVDALNKDIKAELIKRGITEFVAGDVKATITEKENEDFNDLQAIDILRKTLGPDEFAKAVKTREYLDQDGLEDLVFHNQLDASILNPCRTKKEPTITLRLGKVKNV